MRCAYLKGVVVLVILYVQPNYGQEHQIIGYLQSWQWTEDADQMQLEQLPYEKLTIINYSFFYPLQSGNIVGMEPQADGYFLDGDYKSRFSWLKKPKSIFEYAKPHQTKVLLSIGGWDHSTHFPTVSADPEKRAVFAHDCAELMRKYEFAGVDIDWEFPGYKNHQGTEHDRANFTLLLQTLRDSLNSVEEDNGRHYLLTASLPAAAGHLPDIDVTSIIPLLDYFNIMTWDLFGSWGEISNHNSALYGPGAGDSTRSLDGAFKLYHMEHVVPTEKINLGLGFYGHSYTDCDEIYTPHSGADKEYFLPDGDLLYSKMASKSGEFEHRWDEQAQAPYWVNTSSHLLLSLDDERSVALKAEYIIQNEAAGLLIWPLMGDYSPDGQTPLLDIIQKKFAE